MNGHFKSLLSCPRIGGRKISQNGINSAISNGYMNKTSNRSLSDSGRNSSSDNNIWYLKSSYREAKNGIIFFFT
jgi:hypothetical protein